MLSIRGKLFSSATLGGKFLPKATLSTRIRKSSIPHHLNTIGITTRQKLFSHVKTIRSFSNKRSQNGSNELVFMGLRIGARVLGQVVSYAYRSGRLRSIPLLVIAVPFAIGGGIFLANAERVPYSNRLHMTWLNDEDEMELSKESRETILNEEKEHLLSSNEDIYKVTWRIVQDMLDVCEEDGIISPSKRSNFSLNIIKSKIPNAFVLPDGSIFVYTGLLPIAETEAGLACVLGHEISHSLARHSSEKIGIVKSLILLFEFIRGLTDYERSFSRIFIEFLAVSVLQVGLPYAHSRSMEQEADRIGMKLAAKAGYDPKQAAALWERMIEYEGKAKLVNQKKTIEGEKGWKDEPSPFEAALLGLGLKQAGNVKDKSGYKVEKSVTPLPTISPKDAIALAATKSNDIASSASSNRQISRGDRFKELLSTHPCHARRIEDLEAYVSHVQSDYDKKLEALRLSRRPIPNSLKFLPYEGVKKQSDTRFDYDYGWNDQDFKSAFIAQRASSLMAGPEGEQIENFLKIVGRANVPWGGGH